MSPAAAFHAQLASIMEVLANTAVAEICELVDSGYSVLQLEISRSRKENELLRRKLRLMELRAARTTALRAATACGNAPLPASGRARAQPPAQAGHEPESDGAAREEFCRVVDAQTMETEAPPSLIKQEVADEGGSCTRSWVSGEVSSTSGSVQKPLNTNQRSEDSSYDRLAYEPQLQHGSVTTQNPLSEDPVCSYALNTNVAVSAASDSGCCSSFHFAVAELAQSAAEQQQPAGFQNNQQRAPLLADEPQLPVRKDVAERQNTFIRRDRWRHQDGVSRVSDHSRGDGGGKTFVCNCCGKTLACLKNLKTHMRVHTGEKPFVCTLCGKRFSDSSNLKRHQSVHTGEKRYGCVHCGKRFAQSGSLKVHMTVHTDCKQFRCSYCGKTFISGSHLRRHVTMHAGEKQYAATFQ
uniref:zinc finger protein 585A-like isoform X3 n=1 Tax=Scatophagus argus TaxID=75038 RepID=UPI001ED7FFFF|nr:zinc finger protein 585A-like isoform X3 [Scatophagus argus]